MQPEFEVHRLNEKGLAKAAEIANVFDHTVIALLTLCPAGRHLSIVRTKLEEACFFAKKAMACAQENQQS